MYTVSLKKIKKGKNYVLSRMKAKGEKFETVHNDGRVFRLHPTKGWRSERA